MRLGDLDALKENLFIKFGNQLTNGLLDEIDNAPTVEHSLLPLASDLDSAYMRGYEVGKAEGILKANTRPQGEWIAVKDKLPNTDGFYLVSLENGQIVVAHSSGIIENHDFEPKMLAWQPLPEPYKAGGKEE